MSRYCGTDKVEGKFEILEQWKDECLLGHGSLITEHSIWNKENFEHLEKHYVENLDEGDGDFFGKLEGQLSIAPDEAKILCAEVMWILLFCPNNISPSKKRDNISKILKTTNYKISKNTSYFSDIILTGFGSGGAGYNNFRWKELVYAINLFNSFYSLPKEKQQVLAGSAIDMREWLENIPDNENRQFRHMFLFMLFPDEQERIYSANDRYSLLSEILGKKPRYYSKKSAREIDELLAEARLSIQSEYDLEEMDWYVQPIKALWQPTTGKGDTSANKILPYLKKFIKDADNSSLEARNYPRYHKGYEMRISFGKGNQAHVPWMGFLGLGQSPQEGIYPVYLYFKADNILVLAKGVSATRPPSIEWDVMNCKTVLEYFNENIGHKPIRYPQSYVFAVYKLDRPLDEERIENDLERLLSEYSELVDPYNIQAEVTERAEKKSSEDNEVEDNKVDEDTSGYQSETVTIEPFSIDDLMRDLFIPEEQVKRTLNLLKLKKNIILQGPPGVGKTFVSKRLAYGLLGEKDSSRVGMVQFHQSYSYEDFIQGYRPSGTGFELKNGLFYQFCKKAQENPDKKFVFIIDEINRGNLSKVFGELMMLIEADKRGENWAMPLTYSKNNEDKFYIPDNLYIIGLMNTADRSLAVVDYALRRRFAFIDLEPQFNDSFKDYLRKQGADTSLVSKIIKKMSDLNQDVEKDAVNLGKGYCIGHSFFCSGEHHEQLTEEWYRHVIKFEIEPLIREYWFDNSQKADQLINELLAD